jgi:hypothetical protein
MKPVPLPGATNDINNSVTLHRWTGRSKELPGSEYILYALRPPSSQCLLSGMTKPQRRLAHSVLFGGSYRLCCMFRHSQLLCTFRGFFLLWNSKSERKKWDSVVSSTVFIGRVGGQKVLKFTKACLSSFW